MNIYKPSGAQNLPIFIWIHGGGFVDGQRLGSKFEISFKLYSRFGWYLNNQEIKYQFNLCNQIERN